MFRIYDGRIEFYQWDLNRQLIVEDPTVTEVHFCNKTDDCSLVVEVYEKDGLRLANVPNILLQDNWDIRVYGYCGDYYTKAAARFKVVGRTRPADYVYTEVEIKSWDTMEQRCEDVLALAETIARGANSGKSFMDYPALVEDLNTAERNKYFSPQHLLIKTLNVPDVWIYEVKEEKVAYEYVDDATFSAGVVNGLIQVGYYVLSALETGKVDLTDYYTKEEVGNSFLAKKTDKVPGEAGGFFAYGFSRDGSGIPTQSTIKVAVTPMIYGIPRYNESLNIKTNTPTQDIECANKKYVDEKVASLGNNEDYVKTEDLSAYVKAEDLVDLVKSILTTSSNWSVTEAQSAQSSLRLNPAQDNVIAAQASNIYTIPPAKLAYAVKVALTNPKNTTWSPDDKAAARKLLGIE